MEACCHILNQALHASRKILPTMHYVLTPEPCMKPKTCGVTGNAAFDVRLISKTTTG